ncbi:MAG: VOC family protein [Hyphomicrobiales bacterium]
MTKGIDHLVLCVKDLGATRERYQAMGFTMTPVAVHPFGTTNSLVQFSDKSFLEPLAIKDRSLIQPSEDGYFSFAQYNQRFIEKGPGEGFSMLVMDSTDSEKDHAAYHSAGLNPYNHFGFRRQATLPSGEQVEVRFSMAFMTSPDMPDAAFFCCQQHHAPELFWKSEFQTHANTATGMAEVIMLTETPSMHAPFFAKLAQSSDIIDKNDEVRVKTARGDIVLLNASAWGSQYPESFAPNISNGPRLAAYKLHVNSLKTAEDCLNSAGISVTKTRKNLLVDPIDAFGVMIAFCEN